MNKKNVFQFLIIISILLSVSGCLKKAKEDPFISFHTRKARMTGEWEAAYYFYRIESKTPSSWYNYAITMNEGGYSVTYVDGSVVGSGKGKLKIDMTFDRDGNFTRTDVLDGDKYSSKGTWDFKSGIGDAKAKSQLVLYIQSDSSSSGVSSWTGNYADFAYDITELRNKRIKLSATVKSSESQGNIIETMDIDIVLVPKE